jgi:hypothetical protein
MVGRAREHPAAAFTGCSPSTDLGTLQIRRRPVLNGLINEYTHAA